MNHYEREWANPNYRFLSYSVDGLNFKPHFHESYEICYAVSGGIDITINETLYSLSEGEAVIIFPRQIHSYKSDENSVTHIITFMPSFIGEFSKLYGNMLPSDNRMVNFKRNKDMLMPNNEISKKGLLYSVLGELTENTEFSPVQDNGEAELLIQILSFIEHEYANDCTLKRAATTLSYGYTYLSKLFKKNMGVGFTEYVARYRINRAVFMLTETDMRVKDVAACCGYDSLCSFNRNFKAFTGITPVEMIKKEHK